MSEEERQMLEEIFSRLDEQKESGQWDREWLEQQKSALEDIIVRVKNDYNRLESALGFINLYIEKSTQ